VSSPEPTSAPEPEPTASVVVQRIQEVLPDAPVSLITSVVSQQDNTLTNFVTLLVKEEQRQEDARQEEQKREDGGVKEVLINDTTCKP